MSQVYWLLELEINSGQLEAFHALMRDMVEATQANEPGTLNYEWSVDNSKGVCHIYERYADSAAVMAHMAGFKPFAQRFMTVFKPIKFSVYGAPDETVKKAVSILNPVYLICAAGFSR